MSKTKFWYCLSILFCLYSLNILIKEQYEMTYVAEDTNRTDELNFLECENLKVLFKKIPFYSNKTAINLIQFKDDLYNYFNNSDDSYWKINYEKRLDNLLNKLRTGNYLIWFDLFCIILDTKKELNQINVLISSFHKFVFKKDTYHLIKLSSWENSEHLIVINEQDPYSNCIQNYSKFECLNNCFKKTNRLSKYYYNGNETGSVYLDYDMQNRSIFEQEIKCSINCKFDDCILDYFIPLKNANFGSKPKLFIAHRLIDLFEFKIQLIGLICLFIGVSVYQLLFKLMNYVTFQVLTSSKRDKFEPKLFYLKLVVFLIGLVYCLVLYYQMIIDYKNRENNPIKKETSIHLYKPETLKLVICMPVNDILETFKGEFDDHSKMSFLELEKNTNKGFQENVDEIYVKFQDKKININLMLTEKVFFQFFRRLERCFEILIHPNEPKYHNLLSISKLIISFKKPSNSIKLYLLTENEQFNWRSFLYTGLMNIVRKETKISKLNKKENCIDYEMIYSNCTSKWDCIYRCINRESLKTDKHIIIGYKSVIYKDHFTIEDWTQMKYFKNRKIYQQIYDNCSERIANYKNCFESKYERTIKINEPKGNFKQIDLYYDVIKRTEERPSGYKLILNILNIQSILFGLNAFKILLMIYFLIRTKFKLKEHKIHFYAIYLLSLIGFLFHTYHILNEIINGDLIYSHYESSEYFQMPEIIYCFDFDQRELDFNHKITGNYLEELTKEIKLNSIFENISYLNESNEWINLKINFTDQKFQIDTFYFIGKKCFIFKNQIEYERSKFRFKITNEVMKVNFNHDYLAKNQKIVYFLTKLRGTWQFTKIIDLFYFDYNFKYYSINQELFEIKYEDKFDFIKNPSLFNDENDLNDFSRFLSNLINNKFDLRTLNLPIEKQHFNLEIDDDLFEQYFNQIENVTSDDSKPGSNYRRQFAINHLEKGKNSKLYDADLNFELIFFKKIIVLTNQDNFAKLIMSLLNALSIWLNLDILDLHVYILDLFSKIRKVGYFFNFIHKLLLKFAKILHKLMISF